MDVPTLPLIVRLYLSLSVCDVSGEYPFDIVFEIRRSQDVVGDPRSLTFLITHSVVDVPSALAQGNLELVDVESCIKVKYQYAMQWRPLICTNS